MRQYPQSIEQVIKWFSKFPGVGYKSAERMALKLIDMPVGDVEQFAQAMVELKKKVRSCEQCNGLSDSVICRVCSDPARDKSLVCVVEQSRDMIAVERGGGYRGVYFVLGGKLSPINGIGPDELAFDKLAEYVSKGNVAEIILATGSDVEGEATAIYAAQMLKERVGKISRIAYGVPVGSSLDYADEMTLMKAIDGRREY